MSDRRNQDWATTLFIVLRMKPGRAKRSVQLSLFCSHRFSLLSKLWMEDGPVVYPAYAFDSRLRGD